MRNSLCVAGLAVIALAGGPLPTEATAVEPGHSPLRTVSFQDAAETPSGTPAPPATVRPAPSRPAAQAGQNSAVQNPAVPAQAPPNVNPQPVRPVQPAPQQPSPFSGLQAPSGNRSFLARMQRAPDMFGDFNTLSVSEVNVFSTVNHPEAVVQIPGSGATRRYKNEQARALPTDRAFVFYNHFHNALELSDNTSSTSEDINQFTMGFEQTFGDGDWSFEVRLPVSTEVDLATQDTSAHSDGLGNLAVTLKRLLYSDSDLAVALGLAVTAPTGDDADISYFGARLTIENEATHLLPYLAVQYTPDEDWFFHAFGQVDVAANGDGLRLINGPDVFTGRTVDQTLMFLDASAGYWWMRDNSPDSTGLTGLASVLELHYSTALNDAHSTQLDFLSVGNRDNRFDAVNLTMGLHTEWEGDTALRLAAVVPLRDSGENRFFDAEFQVALIKRFR